MAYGKISQEAERQKEQGRDDSMMRFPDPKDALKKADNRDRATSIPCMNRSHCFRVDVGRVTNDSRHSSNGKHTKQLWTWRICEDLCSNQAHGIQDYR